MANPRKMPFTNLSSDDYKRLRERLYYRRVYKTKKIAQVKAWRENNPDKVVQYSFNQRSKAS